jgi:flagellar biosynthesis GTPase FlhF
MNAMSRPIFISYRRDDSEGQAGRLFEALRAAFGPQAVFMDVATIEPGVDFRRAIDKHTAGCGALLALIGKRWLTATDAQGRRRLDDPDDFVRMETAAALRRDIPVIPVLVQDASMVRPEDLPDELKNLAFRNSVVLSHARWDSDVELLVNALQPLVEGSSVTTPAAAKRWLPAGLVLVAAGIAGGGWWMLDSARDTEAAAQVVAKAASEKAANDLAAGKAAADKAAKDQVAREEAAAKKEAADKAAANRAAAQKKLQAERAAAQKAATEREAAEQAEVERVRREAELAAQAEIERKRKEAAAQAEKVEIQRRAAANGECISGFVWREAWVGDKVCVTPAVRSRTASENAKAPHTREPGGGPHGPNTCRQGYVWREARPGDVVCVAPSSRDEARTDNAAAASRRVPIPWSGELRTAPSNLVIKRPAN